MKYARDAPIDNTFLLKLKIDTVLQCMIYKMDWGKFIFKYVHKLIRKKHTHECTYIHTQDNGGKIFH